jgi:hypothetical protein
MDTGEIIISNGSDTHGYDANIPSYFDLPIPVGYGPNNTDRNGRLHLSGYGFCDWMKILPGERELSKN